MGIKLLTTFLTVNVNRCLFNLTLYNFDKMCLIALIYNKTALLQPSLFFKIFIFVPNFVSSYCEMHIEGIQTSLPCFLLLAQFVVYTYIPIQVGLATCVLKRWHKGTKVHHNMKPCACSKGGTKVHHISPFRETRSFTTRLKEGCQQSFGSWLVTIVGASVRDRSPQLHHPCGQVWNGRRWTTHVGGEGRAQCPTDVLQ